MQKGDFGKRAVMKYLCVKCRWGGCGGWKCLERSLACLGRHVSWSSWKYEIPSHVGPCLDYVMALSCARAEEARAMRVVGTCDRAGAHQALV